ncbi:MAG: pilus assembly protein [Lentisphaeria bacterium]|nr:pilus assembly protein [Lentisphaeria bacterium]
MTNESGSMLMETVIAMPLLLALTFGALQIAHIHTARQIASYAAYAAARAALSQPEGRIEEEGRKAALRVLAWLAAAPDGVREGVLMPDPEAKYVKDRLLEFKVTEDNWRCDAELKFAFPLVIPFASQIIGCRLDPVTFTKGETGSHISTRRFGDEFSGPHLVFHERMSLVKPYKVKE